MWRLSQSLGVWDEGESFTSEVEQNRSWSYERQDDIQNINYSTLCIYITTTNITVSSNVYNWLYYRRKQKIMTYLFFTIVASNLYIPVLMWLLLKKRGNTCFHVQYNQLSRQVATMYYANGKWIIIFSLFSNCVLI